MLGVQANVLAISTAVSVLICVNAARDLQITISGCGSTVNTA